MGCFSEYRQVCHMAYTRESLSTKTVRFYRVEVLELAQFRGGESFTDDLQVFTADTDAIVLNL